MGRIKKSMKISNFGSGIAFLSLACGVSTTFAQPDAAPRGMVDKPKPPRVRPTEPGQQITQDLLDFVEVFNAGPIYPAGQKWIYGARIGFFGANEWARENDPLDLRRAGVKLKIDDISVDKIEGESATVSITHSFTAPADSPKDYKEFLMRERVEKVPFKLGALSPNQEKIWQIVPPEADDLPDAKDDFWANLSFVLAQKTNRKGYSAKAKRSMRQLKMLGLGVIQLVQDYDERYAFAPEYMQEALLPYLRDRELFFLPDSKELYAFNENLSDKSVAQVGEPARTVMFYEGADEKPTFRYDGKAAIGFADGHVALVSPDEAAKLIWKP